jgi:hypothetical protein
LYHCSNAIDYLLFGEIVKLSLPSLVKYILGKEEDIKLAEFLIEKIKDGNFTSSKVDRNAFLKKDPKFTGDRYYKVLKILQEIGLVRKKKRLYYLDYSIVLDLLNEWLEMVF